MSSHANHAHEVKPIDRADDFEQLYRSHYGHVCMYLKRLGLEASDAHEVAQDAFVRIYERFDAYRGDAEWTYLKVTVRRVLLNWVRSRQAAKRCAPLVALDDGLVFLPSSDDTPEKQLIEHEITTSECNSREDQLQRLRRAISTLPPAPRSCLLLALAGYKHADIAEQLRTTPTAVKARLHNARQTLRSMLIDQSSANMCESSRASRVTGLRLDSTPALTDTRSVQQQNHTTMLRDQAA
jgi:RNA polymerase sigma-70 factor (ECF subfamily)